MARAVALFGRKLSGGVQALAGLFNNEAVTVIAQDYSPLVCGFGGCACAPPSPWSNGNTVYVPQAAFDGYGSGLYRAIVHEFAHIVDWHSSWEGLTYSTVWANRTPLADYAETGMQPWDRFAEAVTVYVTGSGADALTTGMAGSLELSSQMDDMQQLLEYWGS